MSCHWTRGQHETVNLNRPKQLVKGLVAVEGIPE